jgi:hypothetical protein
MTTLMFYLAAGLAVANLFLFAVLLGCLRVIRRKYRELRDSAPEAIMRRELRKAYKRAREMTPAQKQELEEHLQTLRSTGTFILPDDEGAAREAAIRNGSHHFSNSGGGIIRCTICELPETDWISNNLGPCPRARSALARGSTASAA